MKGVVTVVSGKGNSMGIWVIILVILTVLLIIYLIFKINSIKRNITAANAP
jgi:hypothetical protein